MLGRALPSHIIRSALDYISNQRLFSLAFQGNADMTRFCITMSIPRNGADSDQGFTTLRFWNCIMCSTAFVGTKPEIVQRIHYPHLFTYQPEWLSHAGICTRCQNALAVRTPKITIYAINEMSQYPHSYTAPPPSVPTTQMCHAPPGQCNCAANVPGVHGAGVNVSVVHGPGVSVPGVAAPRIHAPGVHVTVPAVQTIGYPGVNSVASVKIKSEPVSEDQDSAACPQHARNADVAFHPISFTQ